MGLKKIGGVYYNDYGVLKTQALAKNKARSLARKGYSTRITRAWNSKTGRFSLWQVWARRKKTIKFE